MKNCAIVCEYNPFHTGHLYQISKASKKYDGVICIMSGNFVQRAQPAIVEKYTRATVALNCGASMVVELPVVYAVATGEKFADGAIRTLSQLKDVDAIVMGAETDDSQTDIRQLYARAAALRRLPVEQLEQAVGHTADFLFF